MREINTERLLRLIETIDEEWTDGLCQNSVVMSNSRTGKEDTSKLVRMLGPQHEGASLAWAAFGAFQTIFNAEEGEDLRQKGISGLWEQRKGELITVIKAYEEAQKAGKEQPHGRP